LVPCETFDVVNWAVALNVSGQTIGVTVTGQTSLVTVTFIINPIGCEGSSLRLTVTPSEQAVYQPVLMS